MTAAVWVVTWVLASAFLIAGTAKTLAPRDVLAERGLRWTRAVHPLVVKFIGVCEALGAIGLVVPLLTGIAPILAPLAAIGLCCIQACAIVFHVRRAEWSGLPVNAALFCLCAFVAVCRLLGF